MHIPFPLWIEGQQGCRRTLRVALKKGTEEAGSTMVAQTQLAQTQHPCTAVPLTKAADQWAFTPIPSSHLPVSTTVPPASSGPAPPQTPIQPISPLPAVSSACLPLLAPGQQPLLSSKHPFLDLPAPSSYCPLLGFSFTAKPLNQGCLQTHFPLPYLPPPSVWL